MKFVHLFLYLTLALAYLDSCANSAKDPTLYEYYTSGGIHSGLGANSSQFTLNGKPIVLFSGTFHYFRVIPERWRPVLQRMRAAGINAVQTYIAWNAHEDIPGVLDFESKQLDFAKFLEEVKLADMLAIVRPGPYICAEWEFGGLPSWLLRDPYMAVRSNYKGYLEHVKPYWNKVMSILNKYTFSVTGGPVVMVQLENEFGGWIHNHTNPHDSGLEHIKYLLNITRQSGYKDLLFTCDNTGTIRREPVSTIPELLEVINGNDKMYSQLMDMRTRYPNKPVYVSEFWNGWFNGWTEPERHRMSLDKFSKEASDILFHANGSINFFPFIGGTNFGFMNGAYVHQGEFPNIRVTTSYDFDAPLSESGNYTDKYYEVRKLYDQLVSTGRMPKLYISEHFPQVQNAHAYGTVNITRYYPLGSLLKHAIKSVNVTKPVSMENLNIGQGYGQRYGFVLYRVESKGKVSTYEITGPIADRGTLMIDDQQAITIQDAPNLLVTISSEWFSNSTGNHHLDMLVENMGRPDDSDREVMAQNTRKGITSGKIRLNGQVVNNLTIYSLDFNRTFIQTVTNEPSVTPVKLSATPALYVGHLFIDGEPADTYLTLPGWTKGSVFVNGYNIGRYWSRGPQKTLYIPGPLLKNGDNQIAVFELHYAGDGLLKFVDQPNLG